MAQEEARLLGHDYIGTEHVLLGLLAEPEGVAARALVSLGISAPAVRSEVERVVGRRPGTPAGHIPFTPRAKKVLELSLREALQLGHNYIGTEHILLGLVREGEGLAAQVLVTLGADLRRVREQVLTELPGQPESISTRRSEYDTAGLERADLAADPITQFIRWFEDASNAGLEEPHAMTLATTTADRRPDARMVLLRGVDERGFVWFTNRNSPKGRELEVTPFATLVFAWIPLHRQIRVDGEVTIIDDAESDAYFASRPRAAQIGAWASQQSEVLDDPRRSTPRLRRSRNSSGRERSRGRRTGAGTASRTRRSRCGRAGRTGSTIASATGRSSAGGSSSVCGRDRPRPGRGRQPLDERLGVRDEPRPFPVRPDRAPTSHAWRQLELHPAAAGQVHRVLGMEAAQGLWDVVEVGHDRVLGECGAKVRREMICKHPVVSAEQQGGPEVLAPVAVHGDDDVDVVEERGQRGGVLRPDRS